MKHLTRSLLKIVFLILIFVTSKRFSGCGLCREPSRSSSACPWCRSSPAPAHPSQGGEDLCRSGKGVKDRLAPHRGSTPSFLMSNKKIDSLTERCEPSFQSSSPGRRDCCCCWFFVLFNSEFETCNKPIKTWPTAAAAV